MLRAITIAGALSCGTMFTGCAADATPTDPDTAAPTGAIPRAFQVELRDDATAESATTAILAAGHDQFVTACHASPDVSVRIMNPLASGAHVDVPCSAIPDRGEQTSAALMTHETTGETQQRLTPLGPFLCGLTSLGISFVASSACNDVKPSERNICRGSMLASDVGWLVVCSFMF